MQPPNTSSKIMSKNKTALCDVPLVVTTGEPAGIGMDIVLQLAAKHKFGALNRPIIVLADETELQSRASQIFAADDKALADINWQCLANSTQINEIEAETDAKDFLYQLIEDNPLKSHNHFYLIDVPCQSAVTPGALDVNNASMVMAQLELAHRLSQSGIAAGIVTGPLQKSILIDAGLTLDDGTMFTGHTEFFMQKSGRNKVVMMLANNAMKVALVTIHLPLREVPDAVTPNNVRQTVQILLDDLNAKFGIPNPKVLVCGLNPHAGEGGHLGTEEIEIINPVLREFQDKGFDISSAMPADTLFTTRHLEHCDAVIAMYHDQGLPVLKSHGFGDTVNLTLGLPYIRTSVDHGTALDLAGKRVGEGAASSSSLWQALIMADDMATAQATLL